MLTAALDEAISFASGERPPHLELELLAPAPVGAFVLVRGSGRQAEAHGEDGRLLARATALP